MSFVHTVLTARSVNRAPRLRALAAALTLGLGFSATLAQANDFLTTFRDAVENDPVYAAAKASLEAAREKEPQGFAGLLPTVNGTANLTANYLNSRFFNNPPPTAIAFNRDWWSAGLGISASQPLYRKANWETWQQSKLVLAQAEAVFSQARIDLILRTSQAYFDVLAAQDTLTFVRIKKTAVGEQLAQAKRNFEVGTSTIVDTHEAQARYDLVIAEELVAENDVANKRTAVRQITTKQPGELKSIRPEIALPPVTPPNIDHWVDSAETGNYNVLASKVAAEIATREIEKQRAGHYPTLDLVANVGLLTQDKAATVNFGSTNKTGSLALQLAVPIYQGGIVDSRVREALALRDKAGYDIETARRAAAQNSRQAFLGVTSGLSQVRAFQAAQVSSQSALDSNKLGYEVGVRINIDVLNAQQQLFQTRRDLAKARYDTIINGLRLKSAAGALDEPDVAVIDALLVN